MVLLLTNFLKSAILGILIVLKLYNEFLIIYLCCFNVIILKSEMAFFNRMFIYCLIYEF